ncbi:DUF4176 domain-containing protein [Acetivibrio ethanolgignens]|uniref:DUF4176 domain-containing protein n=1 Tax=Acetivibrio ethanolgignens TaxID=290052 RepID=UPI00155E3604
MAAVPRKKYLPIGSVVRLTNASKKIIIFGRMQKTEQLLIGVVLFCKTYFLQSQFA